MKWVIILRGIPGSGKSTVANLFGQMGAVICSTDNYHMINGEYKFNPKKLGEYHNKNLNNFIEYIQKETQMIIVDNTNIKRNHYLPYIEEAKANGYEIYAITFVPQNIEECIKRNVHGAPEDVIRRMASALQANIDNKAHNDFDREFFMVGS